MSSKGLTLQTVSLVLSSFPLFYLFIVMYYTEIAASTVSEILVITELIVGGKGTENPSIRSLCIPDSGPV